MLEITITKKIIIIALSTDSKEHMSNVLVPTIYRYVFELKLMSYVFFRRLFQRFRVIDYQSLGPLALLGGQFRRPINVLIGRNLLKMTQYIPNWL